MSCKWSSLNCPGTERPLSHPIVWLDKTPFPTFSPLIIENQGCENEGLSLPRPPAWGLGKASSHLSRSLVHRFGMCLQMRNKSRDMDMGFMMSADFNSV